MGQLIKKSESNLTIAETELVEALKEPRFVDMSPELISKNALLIVTECANRVGQIEISEGIVQVAVEDLKEAFTKELKQMTFSEVKLAVKTQSKLDNSFSISSRVIFDWINTWRQTKKLELQKAIKQKKKYNKDIGPKLELTREEKIKLLELSFERFKNKERINPNSYDYLKDLGLPLPENERQRIFDKARKELIQECEEQLTGFGDTFIRNRIKEIKSDTLNHITSPAMASRIKKLCAKYIFKDCIDMDMDIKDLIN